MTIQNGFAGIGAGTWLVGHGQPAAFFGKAVRRRRTGWLVRDRGALDVVETTGEAQCADSSRAFLTHIPCAAPIAAVSSKVLVAPAEARTGALNIKVVPMSFARTLCVTVFGSEWVVMATKSRTTRLNVAEGETLSVRPEAAVAWSGAKPTGYCPKLGVLDMILPRGPKDLLLTFYGPAIVWVEGAGGEPACARPQRRPYGV